ncbi:unnamed protein product, partial [Didymodactylos carnosus]
SSKYMSIHRLFEPLQQCTRHNYIVTPYNKCIISVPYLFKCADGQQCILRVFVNDGYKNYDDSSDKSSSTLQCTKSRFGIDPVQGA